MKANATKMTAEQVKAHSQREYNPRVWDENVDRMVTKYTDVEFYLLDRGSYEYDRFVVLYTIPEGIRFLGGFDYSGGITSGGFYEVFIDKIDTDEAVRLVQAGQQDKVSECRFPEGRVSIQTLKSRFQMADGTIKLSLIGTSKEARAYMRERSQKYGFIYSKDYIA